MELFYLYCIFGEGFTCNIPYWVSSFFHDNRRRNKLYGGMFVTRIAGDLGILAPSYVKALTPADPPHVYKCKSLKDIGVIVEFL